MILQRSCACLVNASLFVPARGTSSLRVAPRRRRGWSKKVLVVRSFMDSSDEEVRSLKLRELEERLRRYKAPPGVYGNLMQLPSPAVGGEYSPSEKVAVVPKDVDHFPWWQRASVLICLFLDEEMQIKVILTKRNSNLSSHSGEVALPGGKWDNNKTDDVQTALREAHEEIGLEPSTVNVITQLEPFISKLLLRVVPVIALLPNRASFVPKLNEAEVASMFEAPLEMFLQDKNHRVEHPTFLGNPYPVHYFEFDYHPGGERYLIWGATAAILIRAASIVYESFTSSKL